MGRVRRGRLRPLPPRGTTAPRGPGSSQAADVDRELACPASRSRATRLGRVLKDAPWDTAAGARAVAPGPAVSDSSAYVCGQERSSGRRSRPRGPTGGESGPRRPRDRLHRHPTGPARAQPRPADPPAAAQPPGWWVAQRDHHLPTPTAVPASGAATTGLAHGIAGPLATLSIAARRGHTVPGQQEAVHNAATWLIAVQSDDGSWPAHIVGHHLHQRVPAVFGGPSRQDAWCYGSAGIGSALLHAGTATGEDTFIRAGTAALDRVANRPQWDTTGPGICHGTGGALLTAAAHQHLARAAETAPRRQLPQPTPRTLTSDPGLLTGATGTTRRSAAPPRRPAGRPGQRYCCWDDAIAESAD